MAEELQRNTNMVNLMSSGDPTRRVTFIASPQVTENRTVNYHSLEPVHAPGQIMVYKNTVSRTFTISDLKLISRTTEEADANLAKLWRLRGWCMPRFGNSSTLDSQQVENRQDPNNSNLAQYDQGDFASEQEFDEFAFGTELLGAPPEVLYLSAYSYDIGSEPVTNDSKPGPQKWQIAQHINRVPVVITQLTIPYPNDVDYINDSNGTPMPIILNIDLAVTETHAPNSYEAFSLNDFREGRLKGF